MSNSTNIKKNQLQKVMDLLNEENGTHTNLLITSLGPIGDVQRFRTRKQDRIVLDKWHLVSLPIEALVWKVAFSYALYHREKSLAQNEKFIAYKTKKDRTLLLAGVFMLLGVLSVTATVIPFIYAELLLLIFSFTSVIIISQGMSRPEILDIELPLLDFASKFANDFSGTGQLMAQKNIRIRNRRTYKISEKIFRFMGKEKGFEEMKQASDKRDLEVLKSNPNLKLLSIIKEIE